MNSASNAFSEYVYALIYTRGMKECIYKIGKTENLIKRLSQLKKDNTARGESGINTEPMYYLTKKVKNSSQCEKFLHQCFSLYKIDPCISESCEQCEIFEIYENKHREMVKNAFDELEGTYVDFYNENPKENPKEVFKSYPDIIIEWIVYLTKNGYLGQQEFTDFYNDFSSFCNEHYYNKCTLDLFKLFFDKGMKYFYPNSIFKKNKLNFLEDFSFKNPSKVIWDIDYTISVLKRLNFLDKWFEYKDHYDIEKEKFKKEFPHLYKQEPKEDLEVKLSEKVVEQESKPSEIIEKKNNEKLETIIDKLCIHIQFLEKRLETVENENQLERINKKLEEAMNEEKEKSFEEIMKEKKNLETKKEYTGMIKI